MDVIGAVHLHVAAEAISHLVGIEIHLLQRIAERSRHQERGPFLLHEYVEVEIFFLYHGAVFAIRAHFDVHRDHRRFGAQLAHDAGEAILPQSTHHFRGIAHFIGLIRGTQDGEDLALGYRHVYWAQVEELVAEGEDTFAVVISDGAHAGG